MSLEEDKLLVVAEIAAGAGVGIGVVGQEKQPEPEEPGEETGPEAETKAESRTMKVSIKQLKEMVEQKVLEAFDQTRGGMTAVWNSALRDRDEGATMGLPSILAQRLAQIGYTDNPKDLKVALDKFSGDVRYEAEQKINQFKSALLKSKGDEQWKLAGRKVQR